MPSHLSTIGIPVASHEAFARLARQVVNDEETTQYEVDEGLYLRWSCTSGAELWLQVSDRNQVVGMSPHFAGKNRLPVKLTRQITRPGESPFDGAFEAKLEEGESTDALVFDTPDFLRYADLRLPYGAVAQVAAFAHTLQVFASKAARESSSETPPSSFTPVGATTPEGEPIEPPQALATFTGEVRAAQERTNELTGAPFVWVEVAAPGVVYDVVADPDLLDALPPAGAFISGTCWLSARLVG